MSILTGKKSNLLGFTLLELVIAVTIGMFVVLSTVYLYNSAMSLWSRVQELRNSRVLIDFLYIIQNSLMSCKNVAIKKGNGDDIELRCYSSSAMSAPYVMVLLGLDREGIVYKELSPVDGTTLYSLSLHKRPEDFSLREGFIMLKIDKMQFMILIGNR